MKAIFLLLAILVTSGPPVAASSYAPVGPQQPTPDPHHGSCDNYGVFIMVGLASDWRCVTSDGDCVNYGVLVRIGPGKFECVDGYCYNDGVEIVILGEGCSLDQTGACVEDACFVLCEPECRQKPCVDCVALWLDCPRVTYAPDTQDGRVHLECGDGKPCGVVMDPICWTTRFACFMLLGSNATRSILTCQRQLTVEGALVLPDGAQAVAVVLVRGQPLSATAQEPAGSVLRA